MKPCILLLYKCINFNCLSRQSLLFLNFCFTLCSLINLNAFILCTQFSLCCFHMAVIKYKLLLSPFAGAVRFYGLTAIISGCEITKALSPQLTNWQSLTHEQVTIFSTKTITFRKKLLILEQIIWQIPTVKNILKFILIDNVKPTKTMHLHV